MTLVSDLFKPIHLVSQRTKHQFSRMWLNGILQLSAKKQIYFSPQPSGHPVDSRPAWCRCFMVQNQNRVFKQDSHCNNTLIGSHFWSHTVRSNLMVYATNSRVFQLWGMVEKKGASVASFLWSTLVLIDLFPTLNLYNKSPIFEVCCTAVKKRNSHLNSDIWIHTQVKQCVTGIWLVSIQTRQTHTHCHRFGVKTVWTSSCLVDQHYVLIGRMKGNQRAPAEGYQSAGAVDSQWAAKTDNICVLITCSRQ